MGTRVPAMPYAPPTYYSPRGGDRIIDLIMRQGDIEAQGQRERAALHAQMAQQLGGLAGQALDAYFANRENKKVQAEEKQKSQAVQGFFDNWDGDGDTLIKGMTTLLGPERGPKVAEGVLAAQRVKVSNDKDHYEIFRRRVGAAAGMPEDFVARNWKTLRPSLAEGAQKFLGVDPSEVPEEWAPNVMPALVAIDEQLSPPKERGNAQLKDVRDEQGRMVTHQLDPRTGEWTPAKGLPASAPEPVKAPNPAAVGSFEDFVVREYGEAPTGAQIVQARRRYTDAGREPDRPSGAGGGASRGKPLLSGEVKAVQEFRAGLNALDSLVDEVGKTGAGAKGATMIPGFVTEFTGWGADSKSRQALLEATKQTIGKAMEGGVLRKEDEEKYKRMLPLIQDPPEVAKRKMLQIRSRLLADAESYLEVLDAAGRDADSVRGLLFGGQKLGAAPQSETWAGSGTANDPYTFK